MKFARRAGKRDTLEPEVIEIAKKHGWRVKQGDDIDLIAQRDDVWEDEAIVWGGEKITLAPLKITTTKLVEVKTGKAPLTKGQKKDQEDGWKIHIVRTLEDAEELFA